MSVESPPDPTRLHEALIDKLVEQKLITSPEVEAAFRAVRREAFLPELAPEKVYEDRAIPTKMDDGGRPISSSSQPAIMAIMLEQLALEPGQHVLEIGAGTGYNAALIAHIVGRQGRVTTVDIEADLVESARGHLAAAGFGQVAVICGDGMRGYADHAPYDRIILTVAGWDIPPEWLAQLKPEGRLVLPLSFYGPQLAIAFERQNGRLTSRSVQSCGFMPMRGTRSEPLHRVPIGGGWEITLVRGAEGPVQEPDPATIQAWLRAPFEEEPAGLELTGDELMFKWAMWAALKEPAHVLLGSVEKEEAETLVPDLIPPWGVNMGILTEAGLALLATAPGAAEPEGESPFGPTLALHVRSYGPDQTVGTRLLRQLRAWDDAGRPPGPGVSVWALPVERASAGADVTAGADETADACLTRRWHRFCLRWEGAG